MKQARRRIHTGCVTGDTGPGSTLWIPHTGSDPYNGESILGGVPQRETKDSRPGWGQVCRGKDLRAQARSRGAGARNLSEPKDLCRFTSI